MVKATGSIRANQRVPKLNTSSGWPDGQRALERACYLMASRPKARNQVADFCSAPLAGFNPPITFEGVGNEAPLYFTSDLRLATLLSRYFI